MLSAGVSAPAAEEAHDFHVSRLTANYKPAEGRLECTLMTFVDDLETLLATHHELAEFGGSATIPSQESLNLTEPEEHPSVDSLLAVYINSAIQLSSSAHQSPLTISYLGKERDKDPYGMFIYFYIEDAALTSPVSSTPQAKLALESTYMLELYEDQQNVVVWKLDGESADYDLLTYGSRTCDFEL